MLKDGVFLLELLEAISPSSVHISMEHSNDEEQQRLNAQHAISVAWKLGCRVFTSVDDVIEGKSKNILAFIGEVRNFVRSKKL